MLQSMASQSLNMNEQLCIWVHKHTYRRFICNGPKLKHKCSSARESLKKKMCPTHKMEYYSATTKKQLIHAIIYKLKIIMLSEKKLGKKYRLCGYVYIKF